MSERHARLLAAFAERAARLAADLADRALEAETPEEAARLTHAFHTAGRSMRQSIALEQRLEREAARVQQAEAADTARRQAKAVELRKRLVHEGLRPLAWTECEALDFSDCPDRDDAFREVWAQRLRQVDDLIDDAAQDAEAFLAEPLTRQIERLARLAGVGGEDEDGAPPTPPDPGTRDCGEATSPHSRRSG